MRMVIVRIEDNREKINEINILRENGFKVIDEVSTELDKLQEEAFMQIAAYVKCCVDDYIGIVGEKRVLNSYNRIENRLDVRNITGSVRISAGKNDMFIDFNYTGTLNCKNTPPRMYVNFEDDKIITVESTRNGINDLILNWKYLKPLFQEKINEAYDKHKTEIKTKVETYEYLLSNAKSFKV